MKVVSEASLEKRFCYFSIRFGSRLLHFFLGEGIWLAANYSREGLFQYADHAWTLLRADMVTDTLRTGEFDKSEAGLLDLGNFNNGKSDAVPNPCSVFLYPYC